MPHASESPEPIVVACGADENFAMPLAVALSSMVRHLPKDTALEIYILSLGLSDLARKKISRSATSSSPSVKISFVEVDISRLDLLPVSGHLTAATYLRLFLPSLLPANVHKVIYLDSDLLVRDDISKLWNIAVDDYLLLAVIDFSIQMVSAPDGVQNWKELDLKENSPYFNAGLLLINLELWRTEDLSSKLINYAVEQREQIVYHDQEVLNAVCANSWGGLDPTWNVSPLGLAKHASWAPSAFKSYVTDHYSDLWNNPAICHYVSKWKPWIPGHRPHLQSEWFSCLRQSGWFTDTEYNRWKRSWIIQHYWYAINRKIFRRKPTHDSVNKFSG